MISRQFWSNRIIQFMTATTDLNESYFTGVYSRNANIETKANSLHH